MKVHLELTSIKIFSVGQTSKTENCGGQKLVLIDERVVKVNAKQKINDLTQ